MSVRAQVAARTCHKKRDDVAGWNGYFRCRLPKKSCKASQILKVIAVRIASHTMLRGVSESGNDVQKDERQQVCPPD